MGKSSKIDLISLLTENWGLIVRAYAQEISRETFSEEQVKILKVLSDVGVLDLMWSKTAHDFSEAIGAYLGQRSMKELNPQEIQLLIEYLMDNSSKWYTRSIQCNWQ